MIETQVPLKIPPGLLMNGTMMDREGRWADGNLVRFSDNVPTAIGDWVALTTTGSIPSGTPMAAYGYSASDGSFYAAVAKDQRVLAIRNTGATNTVLTLTPSPLPTNWGAQYTWSFANLGDILVFSRAGLLIDSLWMYDPGVGGLATVVSGVGARGVFVTPESFVVVINQTKTLQWSSQGTIDDWFPTSLNSAGDLDVPSGADLLVGKHVLNQSLVWTPQDVWAMNYIGAPLYYGVSKLGDQCGVIGANVVSVVGGVARWMGTKGFFQYDGYVRPLPCEVADYVFSDIKLDYANRFFVIEIPEHNEIQWFYVSGFGNVTPDKYVSYNYANDTWSVGTLSRAAGIGNWPSAGVGPTSTGSAVPLLMDVNGTTFWRHEAGGAAAGAYLTSGPLQVDDGDRTVRVQKIIPDGAKTPDDITLFAGGFPGSAETTNGPFAVTTGTPIDCRFSARYIRYKQTLESAVSRVGIPRIGAIQEGKR